MACAAAAFVLPACVHPSTRPPSIHALLRMLEGRADSWWCAGGERDARGPLVCPRPSPIKTKAPRQARRRKKAVLRHRALHSIDCAGKKHVISHMRAALASTSLPARAAVVTGGRHRSARVVARAAAVEVRARVGRNERPRERHEKRRRALFSFARRPPAATHRRPRHACASSMAAAALVWAGEQEAALRGAKRRARVFSSPARATARRVVFRISPAHSTPKHAPTPTHQTTTVSSGFQPPARPHHRSVARPGRRVERRARRGGRPQPGRRDRAHHRRG